MSLYAALKAESEGALDPDTKLGIASVVAPLRLGKDKSAYGGENFLENVYRDFKDDRKPPLISQDVFEGQDVDRNSNADTNPAPDLPTAFVDQLWDGHALPRAKIEVVLLRNIDVEKRRERALRQARAIAAAPRGDQQGSHVLGGEPTQNQENVPPAGDVQVLVKAEPSDDVDLKPRNLMELDKLSPDESRAAVRAAVEDLKNPRVKVKAETQFSDEVLLDALTWEGINHRYPIPVPQDIAEFPFRRDYISSLYGGNTQETSPKIAKERLEWHGLDDWAFLSLAYNPHVPTRPGYSGLAFGGSGGLTAGPDGRVDRVFVGIGPCNWVYMGQYKVQIGKPLTTTAFKAQKPIVRRTWARGMLRKDWGVGWCTSIWLRRGKGADYKPTEEEWENAEERIKEIRSTMTEEDILSAFDDGDQAMWTYKMTCVGYDEEFVRCLARNADRFVPKPKKPKKSAKDIKEEKAKKKGTGSKRKPIELPSDLDDDAEEDAEARDAGSEPESVLPTRRSSRPRTKRVRSS